MRHTHFHRHREIYYNIVGFARLENVKNGIAHLKGIFRLGSCKGFGRIFKAEIAFVFPGKLFDKLCSVNGYLLDFFLGLFKYLFSLSNAHRIVKMNDCAGRALAGVKGLADNVFAALGKHLNADILGNHVVVDKGSQKFIFGLACCGKTDFDFLESHVKEHLIVFKLFLKAHGDNKALVAVPHVNAAPHRGMLDVILVDPFVVFPVNGEISHLVFG